MTDFFDRFEGQLIKAGKRLARPSARRNRRLIGPPVVVVGLVLALGGVATATVLRDSSFEQFRSLAKKGGDDPYIFARAHGVDPANARKVFEAGGFVFSIARSGDTTCMFHHRGVDSCNTTAEIAAGQGLQVQANCSTIGPRQHTMMIRGLVPPEVAELRVGYNDDSIKRAPVVQGAVVLEAKTPEARDPYPTSIVWVDADGRLLRAAPFPFDGQKLCLPVSTTPDVSDDDR